MRNKIGEGSLFKVYFRDGERDIDLPVLTAARQDYWVEYLGWMAAQALTPGMALRTQDGSLTVAAAYDSEVTSEIHGIEVEDFHTCFVGDRGLYLRDTASALADD